MTKKENQPSVSALVKELDRVFSRFIRLSCADENGYVQCYTCPYRAHYKKMHAGHFISRYYKPTRWLEMNVKPQCPMCNLWRKGNAVAFRERLVTEYGEGSVSNMEKTRHQLFKLDRGDLQEKISIYKNSLAAYV